jgi:adenylylsulfate kinase
MLKELIDRILIFGLSGSGKTTFAEKLWQSLKDENINYAYFNADKIRHMFNDYDFSLNGRIRQSDRMFKFCQMKQEGAIVDFICPYETLRKRFNYFIWMNTIKESNYKDTDKIFQPPKDIQADMVITDFNYDDKIKTLVKDIKNGKHKVINTELYKP